MHRFFCAIIWIYVVLEVRTRGWIKIFLIFLHWDRYNSINCSQSGLIVKSGRIFRFCSELIWFGTESIYRMLHFSVNRFRIDKSFVWRSRVNRKKISSLFQSVRLYLQIERFGFGGNAAAAKLVRHYLRNRQNLLTQKCQSYSLYPSIGISCFSSFSQDHNSISFRDYSFATFPSSSSMSR